MNRVQVLAASSLHGGVFGMAIWYVIRGSKLCFFYNVKLKVFDPGSTMVHRYEVPTTGIGVLS
jgi:hypothetical protein